MRVVGLVVVQPLDALARLDRPLGRGLVGVDRHAVAGEDAVAEGVVEVLVGVDHRDDLAGEGAHQRRHLLGGPSDAWVSTTSSPRSPPTTETFTSNQLCRATQHRSAISTNPLSCGISCGPRPCPQA